MTGAIVNTSTTASDFKGIYIMHAARQSHMPYIPDGNFYFRAPVIIDNPNDYLSFGSRIGDNFLRLYGADFGFGINGGTLRYNVPMGSVHRFYHGATNTAWIDDTGRLKATTFEGIGASLTNVPYASITGVPDFLLKTGGTLTGLLTGTTINATTALQEGGTNLTSKYLQLTGGTLATGNITLTAGTLPGIHSGNGAALTSLTYGNITGVPDFLLKTGGTLTGTLNGTTINATTALQEGGTNLISKYLQLTGGPLATGNITLTAGTFAGIHSGNGAALTALTYGNITGVPDFLLKSGGTLTGLLSATTINTTGNVGIGITNPFAPLTIGTPDVLGSDGFICIGKYKANVGNRCFKIGYDDGFNMCFGDFGPTIGSTSWTPNQFNINWNTGNVGIGTSGQSQRLNVNGTTYFNGASTVIGTLTATTFSGSGASLSNLPLSAYSTTGNDSSYLLKTGGVMTGQITGITTLNGTTGIFSTVSTTNNGNVNTPQLGVYGGTGDRFILYAGTASVHPYSLGINNSVMWY
jgi:hypothetical protein